MQKTLHIFVISLVLILFSLTIKAETAIKLNGVYACGGVLNPAVEIAVHKNFTVQLEGVGSFYQSISLGKKIKNMPLLLGLGFAEAHWFPKESFKGFYCGPTIGYGLFKMQKYNYWGSDKFQHGTALFLGAVIGYQWQVKKWTFDLFAGGGWIRSIYEGYEPDGNGNFQRYDIGTFPGKHNVSAEWLPFKGGLMIGYRL
jgi:hypothetical protein